MKTTTALQSIDRQTYDVAFGQWCEKLQDFLVTFTPLCLTNLNNYHIKCTYYKVMENFI